MSEGFLGDEHPAGMYASEVGEIDHMLSDIEDAIGNFSFV